MKLVEMMVYFLIVTNCSTICYYEQSTLFATIAIFFLAILVIGILRRIGEWLWNYDNKKSEL